MNISSPPIFIPVVTELGQMTNSFNLFLTQLSALSVLEGSGSPEGIVRAGVTRLYMDTTGTTGNILYIKRDADIGGDTSKGWILV